MLAVGETFVRGDADRDGRVGVEDALDLLGTLFNPVPFDCPDAADANDDGVVNSRDLLHVLGYLFGWGAYLPPPFPRPGVDPTFDGLSCCL